jgi:hypothetical protein
MKKSILIAILVTALFVIAAACSRTGSNIPSGTPIKAVKIDALTATLSSSTGTLRQGDQEVTLAFTDASGKAVDVGAVSLNFHMPQMGTMAEMNDAVTFTTTSIPGVYTGKVNLGSRGEWQGQLAYEGAAGKGKTTFSVTAQ